MSVLAGLKPERVFHYFEEICRIPHGSCHTKEISDYLVDFAGKHGLEWRQDESFNVIIRKPAAAGYESAPTVILQGHCDMVCEKKPGCTHDFSKDPLNLKIDGDFVYSEGTTLGGDDGIAIAYMLAILEDSSQKHPALEAVITTDEEVGLLGATAMDTSDLKGRLMINLDSEEEGQLWTSCAGGLTSVCELPMERLEAEGMEFEVTIHGLNGGHSGSEIDKIRANAIKLMGQFLFELSKVTDFYLTDLAGGQKDNAIPRTISASFLGTGEDAEKIRAWGERFQKNRRREYSGTDEGITVSIEEKGVTAKKVLSPFSQQKLLFLLVHIPYGIQKMSGEMEDLVETSMNPGILKLDEKMCTLTSSLRSSVDCAKEELASKVQYLTEFLGGTYRSEGIYPAWEYRKDSRLREIMEDTYEELFGQRPKVKAIHAGLECGIFYEKIPELDCVSFGPDIYDIHTTEERLSISSTERMWKYLLKVLENIRS